MTLTDSRDRYGWVSVINHWAIAALILGLIALGIVVGGMPRTPMKGALMDVHKTLGVVALILALARIAWAATQTRPDTIEDQPTIAVRLRALMHTTLFAATVVLPLAGILIPLYRDRDVSVLGLFVIPGQGEVDWVAALAHGVHEWGSYLVLALVAGHALISLKHHFLDKDPTLRRMLVRTET